MTIWRIIYLLYNKYVDRFEILYLVYIYLSLTFLFFFMSLFKLRDFARRISVFLFFFSLFFFFFTKFKAIRFSNTSQMLKLKSGR